MGSIVVRCLLICIVAAVLAVTQEEKVFDLGQLSQYQGNGKLPDLSGKVIWMSGKEGAGFHVALSPDAQDEVRKTLIGCEKTDDKCYQERSGWKKLYEGLPTALMAGSLTVTPMVNALLSSDPPYVVLKGPLAWQRLVAHWTTSFS
ncbi:hypothetical protein BDP67DRAFT_565318 [Colletotrichum lupini]|nr:hypothetical protein BDP67DRAFT_565318 [Colletotrichum lupini]